MTTEALVDETLRDLARVLRLDRPLAFLDLEATGATPERDRVVEVAVLAVDPQGVVTRFSSLVNPEQPIPAEATAVHHISDEDVRDAPTFARIAPRLARDLLDCDLAGFNLRKYDLRMLEAEFGRAHVAFDVSACRVVDVMVLYHQRERRDLTAAVRFYCDTPHEGHRAMADVEATVRVLRAQLDRYPDLPRAVDALDRASGARAPGALTADGRVEWRDGAARIMFGKHRGRTLQEMAAQEAGYLEWILRQDFPADLKKLAQEALRGTFPQRPQG